jgi:Cys-tRNA(Pro)/Cys-tRNA(Cys) deacylase
MSGTPATQALDALNIPYRFFRHAGKVNSVAQAAEERGLDIDQVVRSIVFRLRPGQYVMVLVSGEHQISWPLLRKYFNQSRLTLATEDEVLEVTGYQLGAVSPFGLPMLMQILVDQSVMQFDEVSIGAGERSTAIILKTFDLLNALGQVEIVQFTA